MSDAPPSSGAAADGGLSIERTFDAGAVRRFSHEAMATVFEVHAVHPDERYAAQAAHAAFALIDRLEGELSRFRANSDITRVNRLGRGESTQVSASTFECLLIARHMFELTGGAFDVSIGTGLPALDLDPEGCVVAAAEGGVQVDLGGIGKGYAVDCAAELLEEWGIDAALVHGGFSSVLALEPPPGGDGWPLTLSDPAVPSRVLARLSARQRSLGASGLRKGAHILDPRTGAPAAGRLAAWVALPRPEPPAADSGTDNPRMAASAVTDALTTAFMLLTIEEIESLCEQSPGLEAWILPEPQAGQGEQELLHFGRPQLPSHPAT
jgi:thiamine biosynthesis lipoprotein